MLKRLISLGAAALASVTSACEDGPTTQAGGWRSPAAWSTMIYATRNGPMAVEIHGQPFGGDATAFRQSVAAAMTNQVFGRPTAFTIQREQAERPETRVVLAFNPPADADPRRLCTGGIATAAAPVPAGQKITVLGAFCDGAQVLASVSGWVAKVEGADDKRFRRLVGQLTRELFGSAP